jgi:Tellurite resistance protein TerB
MSSPVELARIILSAAAIGALLLVALVFRRYWKNKNIQKRLPDAKRVGAVEKDRLLELRRTLGARLERDAARLPRHEVELTRHALWLAMLLEAGADDDIDDAEIDFVVKLYGEIVTNEPNQKFILDAGTRVLGDRNSALSEIAKAAGVGMQSKMHILQGAFLVSIANNVLEPAEANCLREIADALGLSADERALMFDELADSLDLQVARRELPFWESPSTQRR